MLRSGHQKVPSDTVLIYSHSFLLSLSFHVVFQILSFGLTVLNILCLLPQSNLFIKNYEIDWEVDRTG
jgi:hypothetical protein